MESKKGDEEPIKNEESPIQVISPEEMKRLSEKPEAEEKRNDTYEERIKYLIVAVNANVAVIKKQAAEIDMLKGYLRAYQSNERQVEVDKSTSKLLMDSINQNVSSLEKDNKELHEKLERMKDLEGFIKNVGNAIKGFLKLNDNETCCICEERARNICFNDCGHIACCSLCSEKVKECPVCKSPIKKCVNVFF